jgi:hypothetical protein
MPDFRRGPAAIEKAQEAAKGGNYRPFVPEIKWDKANGENEKYILFLNNIDDIPTVSLHTFVPVGVGQKSNGEAYTKYETFISRNDPGIGEDIDPLTQKGSVPAETEIGVAVELEPIMQTVKGRARPKGFKVKTHEYDRKTDEGTETITAPVVGIISQKASNFYGFFKSYAESDGPIETQAFGVRRRNFDKNTTYDFQDFLEADIDLSGLIQNIEGVSYLKKHMEDLKAELHNADSDEEAAAVIGATLLEARLDELADNDRYKELTSHIEKITPKFGKKDDDKKERPARQSQRPESPSNDEDEPTSKDRQDKFAKIREKAARAKAESAA